jgi:hypothetical protein
VGFWKAVINSPADAKADFQTQSTFSAFTAPPKEPYPTVELSAGGESQFQQERL